MNIKVGMVLKYKEHSKTRKVLVIIEQCALLSTFNHKAAAMWLTFEEIEEVYELPKERWAPKNEEDYYFIDENFEWVRSMFMDMEVDNDRIKAKNCFKTQDEVKAVLEKIKKILAE